MDNVLTNLKAIAATLGAVVTALLGSGLVPGDSETRILLGVIGVILTAVTTVTIPNETKAAAARKAAKAAQ